MKDIHDRNTYDLSSIEPSFALYPHHYSAYGHITDQELAKMKQKQGYLLEKPYLAEALRRSDK